MRSGQSVRIKRPALYIYTTPGHLIRRAQRVHTAIWAELLDGELTGPQYAVLASLVLEPGSDQTRVGDLAALDKSSTADVVTRLSRNGWVRREADPKDGRRRLWYLTATASEALRRITPLVARVQQELLAPLTQTQVEAFVRLLARVAYHGEPPGPAELRF